MTDQPKPPEEATASPPEPPGRRHRQEQLRLKHEAERDARLQQELAEVEDARMPLMDHLIELRDRLMKAIGALILGTCVGLYYARQVYEYLAEPFVRALSEAGIEGGLVLVTTPFEGVYTYFRAGLITGLLLSSPVVSYQFWQFVAPGLYKAERRTVVPLAMSSAGLFIAGAAFCFYVIFPYAFPFFITVLGVEVQLSVDGYLSAIVRMMLAFGLCFQLPVGSFFLARVGLIDHKDMLKAFRYAVVVIFVLAAIITPPDPLTQSLLGVPMVLLYLVGVAVAWMFSTKEAVDPASELEGQVEDEGVEQT